MQRQRDLPGEKKKEKDNKDTLYQLQSFPGANLITMRQQ